MNKISINKIKNKKITKTPFALRYLRFIYNTLGRLFPVYFGNRAYQQWFTTTRFKTPAYELHALDSAIRESIEVNAIKVAVYIWPAENNKTDKTLLFIHGWTGRGTQIVNYIKRLNAVGYRVISFDAPAHGNSPGTQTSALEITDAVLVLAKHYGDFHAAITHSFGGMILTYAISLGLKMERAALICPPKDFQILLDNFQRILTLPDSVMQVVIRKSFASHGQNIRDAINTVNNVKKLSCKGLVIHDEDDTEISWRSGEEIAAAWPDARFIKTKGLGHRRIIHDEAVIGNIITFLDDTA
ncbi:MAG: alpha/beta hydrolase [Gammaproteobacteria bacterium]|nr:alpha/beta hydrolase [Gammaproteobacteria bacterium]